jgi:protein-disulfide isomerase
MSESDETPTVPATAPRSSNPYLIPGAIVIAGLVVAGALIMTRAGSGVAATGSSLEAKVLPIGPEDHVFGPKNPDVYLIEYSDYQCPYCDQFHGTVQQILKTYDGKVAWVYRHFPLDSIHPQAHAAAIASECVAEQGGNDAFWSFTDKIFADQRSMSADRYVSIVRELGLDEAAFTACVSSGKYEDRINRDLQNVLDLGGQGTPYTVLLTRKGDTVKFAGALPLTQVTTLVNRALSSLK